MLVVKRVDARFFPACPTRYTRPTTIRLGLGSRGRVTARVDKHTPIKLELAKSPEHEVLNSMSATYAAGSTEVVVRIPCQLETKDLAK